MSAHWSAELRAETDRWRDDLAEHGFRSDGNRLRGAISWSLPDGTATVARVEIEPGDGFPFAPPRVRVLDPGAQVELTFHINRAEDGQVGTLCLWDTDWQVAQAPWRDSAKLLGKIKRWLENTAAGWPDDDDCDLERYLERDGRLVLYDSAIGRKPGRLFRTVIGVNGNVIVTGEERRIRDLRRGDRRSRKDTRLAFVLDIGVVARPLRTWGDVACVLGPHAQRVTQLVQLGLVGFLLLDYVRGGRRSTLALAVCGTSSGTPSIRACESADTSISARTLRAGSTGVQLAKAKVAVVGLGAVGSFLTDLLYRSGVRAFTLQDPEILRPGNVVRHLAGDAAIGVAKVTAVRQHLSGLGLGSPDIRLSTDWLTSLHDAVALVDEHHVVVDATASARATSLLATAADATGGVVVSVCVQRNGDVIRVDRFPLRGAEVHLPALPAVEEQTLPWERGCGSSVSLTPPGAVVAAAELGCRSVIDELTAARTLPASVADVRVAQPHAPFHTLGRLTPPVSAPSGGGA
jgi:hypothetical protein